MSKILILAGIFSCSISSFAAVTGAIGGNRPSSFMSFDIAKKASVYSIKSVEGVSTIAIGAYENSAWKVRTVSMPSEKIPTQISEALAISQETNDWVKIQD